MNRKNKPRGKLATNHLSGWLGVLLVTAFSLVVAPANLSAQEEQIHFTVPSVKPIAAKPVDPNGDLDGKKSNDIPIRYGLSRSEVVSLIGNPTGRVTFGNRVTFYYPDGEVEFIDNHVDHFKWKGKLYTHRKMPRFAREVPGELTIRTGGPKSKSKLQQTNSLNTKTTIDSVSLPSNSGVGSITTSDGRQANTKPKVPASDTTPVVRVIKQIDAIGNDRQQQIEDAGLGEILKAK